MVKWLGEHRDGDGISPASVTANGVLSRRTLLLWASARAVGSTALLAACAGQTGPGTTTPGTGGPTSGKTAALTTTHAQTGAGGAATTTSAASAPTVAVATPRPGAAPLEFWPPFQGQFQVDGLKKVLASFAQATPPITVNMTVASNEKLLAAVAAGTPPDTAEIGGDVVGQVGKRSASQPLDDRMAREHLTGLFVPAQLAEVTWRGKIYGLPALDNEISPLLLWNRDLLQQADLSPDTPPDTLAALLEAAKRLTKLAPDGSMTQLGWEPLAEVGGNFLSYWAPAYGVTWVDATKQQINLVQGGLVTALDYLKAAYQELGLTPERLKAFRAKYPPWNAAKGGMAQGVEAMKITSSVSVGTLAVGAPTVPISTGWAPTAQAGHTFVLLGQGNPSVCLPVGAAQPDAAFRFMTYLTTPAASQIVFDDIGWLNYNTAVAKQLNVTKVPAMRFVLDSVQKAQTVVTPAILPIDTSSVAKGVAAVIAGQQSAQDMLTQVTQQLQGALDQANKTA